MPTALKGFQVRNISGGMVSDVVDELLPLDTCPLSVNFLYDIVGRATQRNGTTLLGSAVSAGNTNQGMHSFVNSAGTSHFALSGFNGQVFAYNGTSWSSVDSGLSTTAKFRFANFIDRVFRVGGGDTLSWDGSGSFGNSQVTGAPSGSFIVAYKGRVYIAGNSDNPDRLFFSTIVNSSGNITWNTATQFIDVVPQDGNNITGLSKVSDLMLIFKDRAMYRWNGQSVDPEIIVDVGTSSQESIAKVKGLVYFFNPNGIYVTDGGYPREISRPIRRWILGVSPSFYSNVCAFGDDDHYYCFVGNITLDGRTFSNVMLTYTVSSKVWSVHTFDDSFRGFTQYINSSNTVSYLGGDTDGAVQTMFSGNTDNGSPIVYEYETKEYDMGMLSNVKNVMKMAWFVDNGVGGKIMVNEDRKGFRQIGEVNKNVTVLDAVNARGHRLKFKIAGSNRSTPVTFDGYEVLEMQNIGLVQR